LTDCLVSTKKKIIKVVLFLYKICFIVFVHVVKFPLGIRDIIIRGHHNAHFI